MRHLIQSTTPPLQLSRLISTHAQHSTLHTVTSFNILLAHAVRVAPVPYFTQIISQMRTSGIAWDAETEKLAVRAHIQAGRWLAAIELAERTWAPDGEGGPSNTPLDVFTDLMHFVLTRKAREEDVAAMAQRSWKLFPAHPNVDTSPRLAYNVVRLLVRQKRRDQAIQFTKRLLESLDSPTPGIVRHCRAIIGLIIRPPEGDNRSKSCPPLAFRECLGTFESLLAHNPSLGLTPDATLTLYLLENLSRFRNRGPGALHKLTEFRAKYGPDVEDGAVRRLITRYAIQEGNLRLAWSMIEREELARGDPVGSLASVSELEEAPWVGDEHIPMQSHLEYIRGIGTESVKWSMLVRNIRRLEKRGLKDSESTLALNGGKQRHGRSWFEKLRRKRRRGRKTKIV
jgi:hypothetical protein